jgi:hypothetical protein
MKFFRSVVLAGLTGALTLSMPAARAASPGATPIIVHQPLSTYSAGDSVTLRARIRSPAGKQIFSPAVFVRAAGTKELSRIALQPVAGEADVFAAQIPATLTRGDFEYYVESFDEEGNGPARVGSPEAPLRAKVAATAAEAEKAAKPPLLSNAPEMEERQGVGIGAPVPTATVGSWRRKAEIVGIGAGAALVAGGIVAGALALASKHDMEHAVGRAPYDSAKDSSLRSARVANVLVPTGVVVAGAAAALLWYDWKKGEGNKTQISIDAGPSGAALHVAGSF